MTTALRMKKISMNLNLDITFWGYKLSEIAWIVFLFSGIRLLVPKLFLQRSERLADFDVLQIDRPFVLSFHESILEHFSGQVKDEEPAPPQGRLFSHPPRSVLERLRIVLKSFFRSRGPMMAAE